MTIATIFMRKRKNSVIEEDPMDCVGNLFDVAIVFDVALILVLENDEVVYVPENCTKEN